MNKNLLYKKYLKYFLSLSISFIFLVLLIINFFSNKKYDFNYLLYNKDPNYFIYNFQYQKANKDHKNLYGIFIGDSSLGNSISAKLYSELSKKKYLNLALNNEYGFAGQYNILRQAFNANSTIKEVIIFNSYFFYTSNLENYSYALTSNKFSDLLYSENKLVFIKTKFMNSIKYIINKENNFDYDYLEKKYIKDDYIIQYKKFLNYKRSIFPNKNALDTKKNYLKKIISFCNKKNIKIVIVNGPIYLENNREKIFIIAEEFYKKYDEYYLNDIFNLTEKEIGDDIIHPVYEIKDKITAKYFKTINAIQ